MGFCIYWEVVVDGVACGDRGVTSNFYSLGNSWGSVFSGSPKLLTPRGSLFFEFRICGGKIRICLEHMKRKRKKLNFRICF